MNRVNELYSEWQALQPLKPEDKNRLDRKFMLEFNYNSNHIEGNTLTYGQTEILLLFGKVVDEANMKDLEEMKFHIHKIQCVFRNEGDEEKAFSEMEILQKEKRGSLYTITARGTRESILEQVQSADPLFAEVLPLSLEEIFISETEVAGYDVKKLIF